MKLKPLLFLLLCFTATQLFPQHATIKEIDQVVVKMKDQLETYEKTEKLKTDSSSITYYYKDGELQVIVVQEKGKVEKNVSWYYSNKLLLCSEKHWYLQHSGETVAVEKTYHSSGKLIAWLTSESSFVPGSSPEFKKLDKELQSYSQKLYEEAMD